MTPPVTDAIVMSIGAMADEASTRHALASCTSCMEVGPFRNPGVRYGAKAVVIAGSAVACDQLRKDGHKGWAKAVRWTVFALYMGVAAHNMREARR